MAESQNASRDDATDDQRETARVQSTNKVSVGSNPQEKTVGGGSTTAGYSQTSGTTCYPTQEEGEQPGIRKFNPLSNFSSYTYKISLYMLTPEAHQRFINNGRKLISSNTGVDSGVYLIAQSGGVNTAFEKRVPGFDFDYYIDDVKFTNVIAGPNAPSNATFDWSFNIIEPYGFSFITKLANAFNELKDLSNIGSVGTTTRDGKSGVIATKFPYVISIKFLGYDDQGNVVNSIIPSERYYDIFIYEMKFLLDGKATIYKVKAADIGQVVGMGAAKGQVNNPTKIVGKTVYEAFKGENGLFTKLNQAQKKYTEQKDPNGVPIKKYADEYDIVFEGNDAELIKNSAIIELDKINSNMSKIMKVINVNDKESVKVSPDFVNKTLTLEGGTPIAQAIEAVILRSKFVEDAINQSLKSAEEPEPDGSVKSKPNSKKIPFKWIKITTKVTIINRDESTNDFTYRIVFTVNSYDVPMNYSAFINSNVPYKGPYKVYDYWFTGKNTEVRKFEQNINNLFYLTDYIGGANPNSNLPHIPGQKTGSSTQGKRDQSLSPQSSVLTSLTDMGSWVTSKIQILGDPDFLMQASPSGTKYYAPDGFTINPHYSQVFIEINFREAVDYNYDNENKKSLNNGLLTVNPFIQFYQFGNPPPNVKGLVYHVYQCVHAFSKGQFTQDLQMALFIFPKSNNDENNERTSPASSQTQMSRLPPSLANQTVGLKSDKTTNDPPRFEKNVQNVFQNNNPSGSTKDDAQGTVVTKLQETVGRDVDSLNNNVSSLVRGRILPGVPGVPVNTGGGG